MRLDEGAIRVAKVDTGTLQLPVAFGREQHGGRLTASRQLDDIASLNLVENL